MIADIVLAIWLVMAAVYGWKRKSLLEFNSLLVFIVSYGLSRVVASALAEPLAPKVGLGLVGTEVAVSFALCLTLYILLGLLWKKLRPVGSESGIRINVDAEGNPIVKGAKLKAFLGALFGMAKGILMYAAVIFWLILLVPILSYKDGKGLTVVHPDSLLIKNLRKVDPLIIRVDWSVKGLRTLRYLNRSRKARKRAYRNRKLRKLLKKKSIKKLRRNKKLLSRANSKKQGRRESTLLLWMPAFQQIVHSAQMTERLKQLAQAIPAPFDQDIQKTVTKKKKHRSGRKK